MKLFKKLTALFLILAMLMPCTALATDYSSQISSIMSSFSLGNIRADSAYQQQANGAYRMVELLEIIALEKGCSSSSVSSIMSSFSLGNIRADSAIQQGANGLYRCVELLELIARKWNNPFI